MKIAFLNDTHCGARNSSDIFIDYQEKFYESVFFPYLIQNGIMHIIHLGDYYDNRKYINFKALNANRRHFLEPLVAHGMTMDIIPGNHDVFYKTTNDLNSLSELLGGFSKHINIITSPTEIVYDSMKIALIPWISPQNYSETMEFLKDTDAKWVGAHLELQGFEVMRGVTQSVGMDPSIFKRFDRVLTGHFHTKSQRGGIQYLGSQFEFTWADVDDPKYFHVLDTDTGEITEVRNPITLFSKIVYNDEIRDYKKFDVSDLSGKFVKVVVASKTNPKMFESFIERVSDADIHELKISETFSEFLGDNVDMSESMEMVEDTPQLLKSYVDSVETDLDKQRLKTELHTLYVEAMNTEII